MDSSIPPIDKVEIIRLGTKSPNDVCMGEVSQIMACEKSFLATAKSDLDHLFPNIDYNILKMQASKSCGDFGIDPSTPSKLDVALRSISTSSSFALDGHLHHKVSESFGLVGKYMVAHPSSLPNSRTQSIRRRGRLQ
jgi:hypothetical protein